MNEQSVVSRTLAKGEDRLPFIEALAVMNKVSNLQYSSKEQAVDSILQIIVASAKMNNVSACDILSNIVEKALLSDDLAPYHVNGIEFIKCCDNAMSCSCTTIK